jgi:hypothetical protein
MRVKSNKPAATIASTGNRAWSAFTLLSAPPYAAPTSALPARAFSAAAAMRCADATGRDPTILQPEVAE